MKWPCSEAQETTIVGGMLTNGDAAVSTHNVPDMARPVSSRSQDDATVTYFFQRPDFQTFSKHSKWANGDETLATAKQSHGLCSDMRQSSAVNLQFDQIAPSAKKLWGVEDQKDDSKVLFNLSDQTWRDSTWSASTIDHAVSQPIGMGPRRSGSFPGSEVVANVLSPRSSETGGLGVKMVEYVLGTSPTGKDLENRMRGLGLGPSQEKDKEKTQSPLPLNDIDAASGLADDDKSFSRIPGSRQPSPSDQELAKNHSPSMQVALPIKPDDLVIAQGAASMVGALTGPMVPGVGLANGIVSNLGPTIANGVNSAVGFGLSSAGVGDVQSNHFQQVMVEPSAVSFDNSSYSILSAPEGENAMLHANFDVQQILRAQQQQQVQQQAPQQMLLAQQQFLAAQQQQLGMTGANGAPAFPGTSYVIGPQEPYMGAVITGPTPMMPQYYGMTPWGMYHPGMIPPGPAPAGLPPSHQPPQRRPASPGSAEHPPPVPQGQYQVIPAFYDQNGSLVMRGPLSSGAPVRLMSPAPMVLNPAARQMGNQQSVAASMYNPGQQQSLYSSAGPVGPGNQPPGAPSQPPPPPAGLQHATGLANNFGALGLQQQNSGLGFNGGAFGSLGSPSLGLSGPGPVRRDSFDRSGTSVFPSSLDFNRGKWAPSYGALGTVTASSVGPLGLAQSGSLTPPPVGGASSCLQMGIGPFVSGGRVVSAAPGSEIMKYRNGTTLTNGLLSEGTLAGKTGGAIRHKELSELFGRSRLLDDFRNNRFPNLQLRDIVNHIVEFSQDQHGSRFIQQKLERATPAEKQLVFNEICVASYALMTDVFGNYVIQKFFEFGTPDQKTALAQKIRGNVLPLALQMYGCRVIQKALESVGTELQKEIVHELDGHVLKCVKDQNGNHVVQKCIECVDPRELQFLIEAFEGQVLTLSTHPYGCRVIQRILEHCTAEQTVPVLNELHQHTETLIQDQYGNYVIQHVLEHGNPEDKARIVGSVRGKVLPLSQHKFASNVVEKCITHATRAERAMLIEEVMGGSDGSAHNPLHTMMKDQYANYVVQKMIDVSEPSQRKLLMHKIRPHVNTLRKYTYGKHILAKLEKYFMKNNVDLGPIGPPTNAGL